DTIVPGPRWLTAAEIMREATGCVLVDDAAPTAGSFSLKTLDPSSAAAFRGRCHGPLPSDHDTTPCIPDGTRPRCNPPPPPQPPPPPPPNTPPPNNAPPSGCKTCNSVEGGMPNYFVSDPFLNGWVSDIPLQYAPAYGPPVWVVLAYNERRYYNVVSGAFWHGAQFGSS